MGLYDGYKQSNSSYISQYVGNVVPELKEFSNIVQKRYNDARDTDDALVEAMGNLQHLDTEEDTTYANELKQTYLNRLIDRSEREDYENMGRRTQRDARAFSSDYVPLVNRMKGMQAIKERVLQDDKIFDPNKKQEILSHIQRMNSAKKDTTTGDFVRDASGKIQLGAIQDWAYAKDVDINKKLADFIKMKEADLNQTGYRPDGSGLMISTKTETRTPRDIAILAKEMMETDPEIKAMIERDVTLKSAAYTPAEISEIANKANVSVYDQLKRAGLSESQIQANLKANGYTLETAKLKPVDVLRQEYTAKGRSPQEADAAYVKHQIRREITDPHVDIISRLLKIDRQTIEAREDPIFAANATANAIKSAMEFVNSGQATPLQIMPDDQSITQIDATSLQNAAIQAAKASDEVKGSLQAAIGSYLGLPKPTGKTTAAWYNTTGRYLNDKAAQGELIQKLQASGKVQEANNLTQAFRQYNQINNKAIYARQQAENITKGVDFKSLYNDYKKAPGDSKMSFDAFKKELTNTSLKRRTAGFGESTLTASSDYVRADEGIIDRMFNRKTDMAMRMAINKYGVAIQSKAQEFGKSAQTVNTVFEPTSTGFLKDQTDMVERGLLSGLVKGTDQATGKSIQSILEEELGSGWFSNTVSDENKRDPNSDYNKALRSFQARINIDKRGANGEPTATIRTPGGQTRTIVLENLSPNLPTEMAARLLTSAGKYLTRGEAATLMQSAAEGVGYSQLRNMNQVDLYNLRPAAKPYQINDLYYLKVSEAGVKGMGSTNVYTLMVKQGDKMVPTKIVNKTQLSDIIQQIGGEGLYREMSTIPSGNVLQRP